MIKINAPMFLFTACGGALAWFLGELFLKETAGTGLPVFLKMGIYFALFAVITAVFALLAETFFPILNGRNWRREYCGSSWKHVVWVALLIGFVTGSLFQFLFDLDFSSKTRNVIMLIDNSGSMLDNDPNDERLLAASNLIHTMQDTNAAVISFEGTASMVQPFTKLTDNSTRNEIADKINKMTADGGTNIEAALNLAMTHISENGIDNNCVVILLSDGYSDVNFSRTLTPFRQQRIPVYTVGLYGRDIVSPQLEEIALYTNGAFYDVQDAEDLPEAFAQIYENTSSNHYFFSTENKSSGLNVFLKILFLMIIGAGIGGGIALVFDNKYLLAAFIFGGAVGGLLSAMVLLYLLPSKLLALMVLASCFSLFSLFVKLPDNAAVDDGWKR